MKRTLALTLFLAMAAQPVLAQQDRLVPNKAGPQGTSSPLPDPHKDGGRPESHGGQVHAPQTRAGGQLATHNREQVHNLVRISVTAQQYGNLASKRHTSGAVHDLGDRMVLTNSRINRALTTAVPDLRTSEQIPAPERATLDSLARDADETQFGISIAQWVVQNYPQAVRALERLKEAPELREMTDAALPEMQAQLGEARRILQTAGAAHQAPTTGTVTDPKKRSD
jgi:hypothetical protein